MHTPAPPDTQSASPVCLHVSPGIQRKRAGFSLIEVTLAIAIVAFAFIALIGLLPAGMSVFNQTMDSTNEMRISSDLTALLQSTEYNKIPTNPEIVDNIYYFDVDGGLLDTDMHPLADRVEERIYAARIFVDQQNIPGPTITNYYDRAGIALKTLVIVGRNNQATLALLKGVTQSKDIHQLPRQKVRVLPLVITKTDGKI
jgi:uncharacterized protein (TIGR02598 family)